MGHLLELPSELLSAILDFVAATIDLCSLRLSCWTLKSAVDPRFGAKSFRTARLNFKDPIRLAKTILILESPLLLQNLQYVIIYNNDVQIRSQLDREVRTSAEPTTMLSQIFHSVHKNIGSIKELTVCCLSDEGPAMSYEALLRQLRMATTFSPPNFTSSRLTFLQQEALVQHTRMDGKVPDFSVETLAVWTERILSLWLQSGLVVEALDLGQALIRLSFISSLAHMLNTSNSLKRISLRFIELSTVMEDRDATDHFHLANTASILANSMGLDIQELVLSCTRMEERRSYYDKFLAYLMAILSLPNLDYIFLDGFIVNYQELLSFLRRHQSTITNHIYENIVIEGFEEEEAENDDEVSDFIFNQRFNEDLQALGLSPVFVST